MVQGQVFLKSGRGAADDDFVKLFYYFQNCGKHLNKIIFFCYH